MPLPDDFWSDPPEPIPANPSAPPDLAEEGIFGPSPLLGAPLIGFYTVETIGVGYANVSGITKLELTTEQSGVMETT